MKNEKETGQNANQTVQEPQLAAVADVEVGTVPEGALADRDLSSPSDERDVAESLLAKMLDALELFFEELRNTTGVVSGAAAAQGPLGAGQMSDSDGAMTAGLEGVLEDAASSLNASGAGPLVFPGEQVEVAVATATPASDATLEGAAGARHLKTGADAGVGEEAGSGKEAEAEAVTSGVASPVFGAPAPGYASRLLQFYLQEPQPEPEPVFKRDPNLITVVVRPVDGSWVMGEDWVLELHALSNFADLKEIVEQARGISRHRMQLRLKGKVLAASRELWTLRRYGVYDGCVVQVEPTLAGAWHWEPAEYYADKLLAEVVTQIRSSPDQRMNLATLRVTVPPSVKTSLRVFLRTYPERIYMHTDITEGDVWVHERTRPFQLPSFGNFSTQIGSFAYFKPARFDWDAYKDIDSMYTVPTYNAEAPVPANASVGADSEVSDKGKGEMQEGGEDMESIEGGSLEEVGQQVPGGGEADEKTGAGANEDINAGAGAVGLRRER
ncbi:hypothetical protein B484DRAFT_442574 [Ochromonadaceae sp. CCMP2298]|nr:hypothetical protein B484DRAFT_442574 [Ochromonadaceae sp. CCMP2298]